MSNSCFKAQDHKQMQTPPWSWLHDCGWRRWGVVPAIAVIMARCLLGLRSGNAALSAGALLRTVWPEGCDALRCDTADSLLPCSWICEISSYPSFPALWPPVCPPVSDGPQAPSDISWAESRLVLQTYCTYTYLFLTMGALTGNRRLICFSLSLD